MKKKYIVTLSQEERRILRELLSRGKAAARKLMHARILLKADVSPGGPGWDDQKIAEGLEVGRATVERLRKTFVEEGMEAALERRKPRRQYRRKLDGDGEAHLVALACQAPPEGRSRWTLRLLADRLVQLEYVDEISYQTVHRTLKKSNRPAKYMLRRRSPGCLGSMGASGRVYCAATGCQFRGINSAMRLAG
jgi:transposase